MARLQQFLHHTQHIHDAPPQPACISVVENSHDWDEILDEILLTSESISNGNCIPSFVECSDSYYCSQDCHYNDVLVVTCPFHDEVSATLTASGFAAKQCSRAWWHGHGANQKKLWH
jgi:hypothetical protein